MIRSGWVAWEAAARLRTSMGIYHWWEWRRFLEDHGTPIVEHDDDAVPVAFHCHGTIFIRRGALACVIAQRVWHEVAHLMIFPLNWHHWERQPLGHVVVAKTERRCDQFAAAFPVWGRVPALFCPSTCEYRYVEVNQCCASWA